MHVFNNSCLATIQLLAAEPKQLRWLNHRCQLYRQVSRGGFIRWFLQETGRFPQELLDQDPPHLQGELALPFRAQPPAPPSPVNSCFSDFIGKSCDAASAITYSRLLSFQRREGESITSPLDVQVVTSTGFNSAVAMSFRWWLLTKIKLAKECRFNRCFKKYLFFCCLWKSLL